MGVYKTAAILLHAAGATIMTHAWLDLDNIPNNAWIVKQKGGHLQYLTIHGLIVALFTMILSLVVDFTYSKLAKTLKRIAFVIAMPLTIVTVTVYWGLLLFMPSLIFAHKYPEGQGPRTPEEAAEDLTHVPMILDLSLHAVPAVVLLIDFFLLETKYIGKHPRYRCTVIAFMTCIWYASWAEYCAYHNGVFAYPFLTFSPFPVRVAVYTGAAAFAYTTFLALNSIHP